MTKLNDVVKKNTKLVQVSWGDWIDLSEVIAVTLDRLNDEMKDHPENSYSVWVWYDKADAGIETQFIAGGAAMMARDELAQLVNAYHERKEQNDKA